MSVTIEKSVANGYVEPSISNIGAGPWGDPANLSSGPYYNEYAGSTFTIPAGQILSVELVFDTVGQNATNPAFVVNELSAPITAYLQHSIDSLATVQQAEAEEAELQSGTQVANVAVPQIATAHSVEITGSQLSQMQGLGNQQGGGQVTFSFYFPPNSTYGNDTVLGLELDVNYASPACYLRGTHIANPGGKAAVEDLLIGDLVTTASGALRAIKWIGRRTYAGRFLSANPGVQPILFRVGSLGNGLPVRDLLVSPEHALFLDGMLVPAICLVNGETIYKDRSFERVDYFHVELDSHDVLLAEGAPSESFIDDDSRGVFHNAIEFAALYPDAERHVGFCAARVTSGYELEGIRCRLADVARQVMEAA